MYDRDCMLVGVSIGGEPACYIIEHHLSRFVEGQVRTLCYLLSSLYLFLSLSYFPLPSLFFQDPANIELMWDQMFRSTINYGRKGLPM